MNNEIIDQQYLTCTDSVNSWTKDYFFLVHSGQNHSFSPGSKSGGRFKHLKWNQKKSQDDESQAIIRPDSPWRQ